MTIGDLKELISQAPDDFEFIIQVSKNVRSKEFATYPFDFERCETDKNDYDIGFSDKKMHIGIEIKEL